MTLRRKSGSRLYSVGSLGLAKSRHRGVLTLTYDDGRAVITGGMPISR